MTQTTEELERPAWGVWVDYKIAPPGSYACLVSRFMDNRWTDPEQQWMPAQLRPQLHSEVRIMPYLMPSDPLAAVNALPELVALRKENERLRKQVSELSDCQGLPKVYKYTGTAEVDVENMFDVGHRHKSGKQPRDYLMSWLSMFRPFAYATKDDSWGELEKLISIVMNNYVQILVKAEKARAAQTLKERNDG